MPIIPENLGQIKELAAHPITLKTLN